MQDSRKSSQKVCAVSMSKLKLAGVCERCGSPAAASARRPLWRVSSTLPGQIIADLTKGKDHSFQPPGRIRTMAGICFLYIPTHALFSFARTCLFRAFRCDEASSSDLRSCRAGMLAASVCPGTASVHATASTTETPGIFCLRMS